MIELDAYFRRIGYTGPSTPTMDALSGICAAHTAAIPFENIDAFLGRAPALDPAALQAKLVAQKRGGYCYEQNALLRLALTRLGMHVTSLAGWVVWMAAPGAPVRPRSHMLLKVALPATPGEAFLADVGFGGHLLGAPLRFVPGLVQRTPGGTERIALDVDVDVGGDVRGDVFSLEAELSAGWTPLYRFTPEAWRPVDYEPLNWFTATHPGSMFRHNLRLERLTPQFRAALLNDKLTLRPVDGPARTRRIETATELAQVLEQVFEVAPPVSAAELFERIPKGLDAAYLPPAA